MGYMTRGPGPPTGFGRVGLGHTGAGPWPLLLPLFSLVLLAGNVISEENKFYNMEDLCKDSFRQQQIRKIEGAVLRSQNEKKINCAVTFQTNSVLQSFMLRFDDLNLDCNDHLFIYDGAHTASSPKADISCKDTRESVGAIYTRTNHVTLKYVTDNWGTDQNGFTFVITAIKDTLNSCTDFKCKQRELCIHKDLVCDDVNHCADGSDEVASKLCTRGDIGSVFGMSRMWFVVVIVSALLAVCAAVVSLALCDCRQTPTDSRTSIVPHSATTNPFQPVHGLNGTGHAGMGQAALGTTSLTRGPGTNHPPHTLSLMQPGNWLCPAGTLLGYSVALARLCYCLVK